MRKFLLILAGGRPDLLERLPGERTRFESLGLVVLITGGVAAVSMWFALTSAVGINPFPSARGERESRGLIDALAGRRWPLTRET